MMTAGAAAIENLRTTVRDFVTGRTSELAIPADWSVDAATRELTRSLALPERDSRNRPQPYELFVHRARGPAERLQPSARIGDVVERDDVLEPMPEIVPGGRCRS
jgi:NADPH-dependent ferric siderophore reductase